MKPEEIKKHEDYILGMAEAQRKLTKAEPGEPAARRLAAEIAELRAYFDLWWIKGNAYADTSIKVARLFEILAALTPTHAQRYWRNNNQICDSVGDQNRMVVAEATTQDGADRLITLLNGYDIM